MPTTEPRCEGPVCACGPLNRKVWLTVLVLALLVGAMFWAA